MKQLLFILFYFSVISNTYASADCLQRPSCEELGYIQTRKQCECFNKDVLPCPFNIKDDNTVFCGDTICGAEQCEAAVSFYNGQQNTQIIFEGRGAKSKAVHATQLFYVGDKDGDFGQGKWYLPAIGEWKDLYGTDVTKMTKLGRNNGAIGDKRIIIENALSKLSEKGAEANLFLRPFYWASNVYHTNGWTFVMNNYRVWYAGAVNSGYKYDGGNNIGVRAALLLKGLDISNGKPTIGDVVYTDKTFGSADDYEGTKTPAGIVFAVSEIGTMVKIINLKDFAFITYTKGGTNEFDPENPYTGEATGTNIDTGWEDIPGTANIDPSEALAIFLATCGCDCEFYNISEQ